MLIVQTNKIVCNFISALEKLLSPTGGAYAHCPNPKCRNSAAILVRRHFDVAQCNRRMHGRTDILQFNQFRST